MPKLCISDSSMLQLERFFSYSKSLGEKVLCFVPSDQLPEAMQLGKKYPIVEKVLELRFHENGIDLSTELQRHIEKQGVSKVYITSEMKQRPLRHLPGETAIELQGHYGLCRSLSRAGAKKFELFSFNSTMELDLPFFLDHFENMHRNERCFILGNGPSLKRIDMKLLRDEITLGCNRIHLGFEEWGFQVTYWTVGDRLQVEEHLQEWEEYIPDDVIKFIPFEYCGILNLSNVCPMNFLYDYDNFPQFSNDPSVLYLGNTTVYYLMQIAVIMGCNPIILVGVDNRYKISKEDMEKGRWTAQSSHNHFHAEYCDKGRRLFVTPRPERAERAYSFAGEWTKERGIKVYNASPGTSLKVFEKLDFGSLF